MQWMKQFTYACQPTTCTCHVLALCYHGPIVYPAAVCLQQVYERAIANVPPAAEKRYWQRYIYLWINYALFEELEAQDADRTREVHRACLKLIPHKAFTFAKVNSIRIPCLLLSTQVHIFRHAKVRAIRRFVLLLMIQDHTPQSPHICKGYFHQKTLLTAHDSSLHPILPSYLQSLVLVGDFACCSSLQEQ